MFTIISKLYIKNYIKYMYGHVGLPLILLFGKMSCKLS